MIPKWFNVHGFLHPKGQDNILHLMIPNILLSSSEDNSIPIANFTKITANVKEYICMEAYT